MAEEEAGEIEDKMGLENHPLKVSPVHVGAAKVRYLWIRKIREPHLHIYQCQGFISVRGQS